MDLWGLVAEILIDDNDIHINIPIKFYGEAATKDNIDKTIEAIQNTWTGKFGSYSVITTVEIVDISSDRISNSVLLIDDHDTSYVNNKQYGVFYLKQDFFGIDYYPATVSHEAGHLMGANDKYYEEINASGERTTFPMEGYENNIMATLDGVVEESIIEEILSYPKNIISKSEKTPLEIPGGCTK